jgi:hypothetical protein
MVSAALSFSTTGAASVFPLSRERNEESLTIQVRIAAESCCRESGGRKAPSSTGSQAAEALRLRATKAVSHDKSVRRSAQDDDSVGI